MKKKTKKQESLIKEEIMVEGPEEAPGGMDEELMLDLATKIRKALDSVVNSKKHKNKDPRFELLVTFLSFAAGVAEDCELDFEEYMDLAMDIYNDLVIPSDTEPCDENCGCDCHSEEHEEEVADADKPN